MMLDRNWLCHNCTKCPCIRNTNCNVSFQSKVSGTKSILTEVLATPSHSAGTARPVHPPSEADAFAYISGVVSLPVLMLPICGAGADADRDDELLVAALL